MEVLPSPRSDPSRLGAEGDLLMVQELQGSNEFPSTPHPPDLFPSKYKALLFVEKHLHQRRQLALQAACWGWVAIN